MLLLDLAVLRVLYNYCRDFFPYGFLVTTFSVYSGGESIYGSPFADEYHSRLRFKHRGLVACANAGTPNSNGSQFFITLDRCDWLDRKNTIFGKVMIMLRMQEICILPFYVLIHLMFYS